jgi:DNA repair exonuclease SbcCD ATPase subunit
MSKKFGRGKNTPSINEDNPMSVTEDDQVFREERRIRDLEDDEDDDRSSLEKTVRARDATVISMDKKRLETDNELVALQKELDEERLRQMEEAILHQLESERLKKQTEALEERLEALERDMQDKEAIHEYANLIKAAAPKNGVDSQYVMKLQSQLAKAMKRMETTSRQMELVEQSCNEVVSSLSSEIKEIVEDRCRTELELRRQLELLEEQKADMQKSYEEQIRKNQEEMERLQESSKAEGRSPDLETELQEAESRLEELNQAYETNDQIIQDLKVTLESAQNNRVGDE